MLKNGVETVGGWNIMNKAVELFTAVPKMHNCAQAVVDGCGASELVDIMKGCGGGNAPGGRCGALHGAMVLVPEEHHADLIRDFVFSAGSELCREIKFSETPFPCAECVRLGAELVEKYR
jgi:hypothetical protein